MGRGLRRCLQRCVRRRFVGHIERLRETQHARRFLARWADVGTISLSSTVAAQSRRLHPGIPRRWGGAARCRRLEHLLRSIHSTGNSILALLNTFFYTAADSNVAGEASRMRFFRYITPRGKLGAGRGVVRSLHRAAKQFESGTLFTLFVI